MFATLAKPEHGAHLPHNGKDIFLNGAGGGSDQNLDFTLGMTGHKKRTTLQVLLLQVAIRIRHFFQSWFFLKPIFSSRQVIKNI